MINLAALLPIILHCAKSRVEPKSTPRIPIVIMAFLLNACPHHSAMPTPTISLAVVRLICVCMGINSNEQWHSGEVVRWRDSYLSFKEHLTINKEILYLFKQWLKESTVVVRGIIWKLTYGNKRVDPCIVGITAICFCHASMGNSYCSNRMPCRCGMWTPPILVNKYCLVTRITIGGN